MVALEIWYRHSVDSDLGPGEQPTVVETVDELEAFIERVLLETKDNPVPPMVQVAVAGDWKRGMWEAGLGQEKGFLCFVMPESGWTKGNPALTGSVTYDYMRHVREIPASAEVPLEVVRQALRKFVETGWMPVG